MAHTKFMGYLKPHNSASMKKTAGVPQGAIWSPLLFNLYIRLLPSVVQFSSIIGYADDHTLLKLFL